MIFAPSPLVTAQDTTDRVDFYGDPLPKGATARLGTTRLRHGDRIEELFFTDDGQQLITRSGQTLRFWETRTGKLVRAIGTGKMTMLRIKSDTFAVLPTRDGEFRFWRSRDSADIPIPQELEKYAASGLAVDIAAVGARSTLGHFVASLGGRILATGTLGSDPPHEIQLWRLVPGKRLKDLEPLDVSWTTEGEIERISLSDDGKRVVIVSREAGDTDRSVDDFNSSKGIRRVTIGNVVDGKQVGPFSVPKPMANGRAQAIAISPDGSRLAIGAKAGAIHIYDMETAKELYKLPLKDPSCLLFSPDGKSLATGSHDQKVRIWNLASRQIVHTMSGHHSWVETLAFSPDGTVLASGGQDNMVHLWNTETATEIVDLAGHAFWVFGASFSRDGKYAVTSAGDGTTRVWDSKSGASVRVHKANRGEWVRSVAASPNGKHYAIAETGRLVVHDFASGEEVWQYDRPDLERVLFASLVYSNDGKTLVATGTDGVIRVWDTEKRGDPVQFKHERVAKANGANNDKLRLWSVALRPDGKQVALVTQSRYAASSIIEIWDLESKKMIRKLVPEKGNGVHLTYTPDGKRLLMAGHSTRRGFIDNRDIASPKLDDSLILWDVESGEVVRRYGVAVDNGQPYRRVNNAAFAKNGQLIITAERDGFVRVYRTDESDPVVEFQGHSGTPHALAVAPDGSGRFLTAGEDLVGMVWDLNLLLER